MSKFEELEDLWLEYYANPIPINGDGMTHSWCSRRESIENEIVALVGDAEFDYTEDGTEDIVTINGCIRLMEAPDD